MEDVTMGFGATEAADGLRAFAAYYEEQRFVGRTAELALLDAWLASDERTILVVAPAGRGKSALLWAWVKTVPDVVWVPISVRFDTARTETVRSLLVTKLGAMGAATGGDWTDMARRLAPVVVVLDGLDECADEMLVDDLRNLPDGVRVVVAARELVDRDASEWAATLGWQGETLELGGLDRAAIAELVGDVVSPTLNQIVGMADGDPLTASLLAEAARSGDEGFERWWEADGLDTQLLTALARATAPAPPALLADVLGRDRDDVMTALHEARRFLVTNAAGSVSFAHPRLGYVFEDRLDAETRRAMDERWCAAVERLVERLGDAGPAVRAYVLQGRLVHLGRLGASGATLAATITRAWLADWEAFEGGTTGFLADVNAAWAAIEAEMDVSWSGALSAEQFRLCAIRSGLASIERAVSPKTRAEAVRLGVRSQRAAVASVGAITDGFRRNEAIKALLPMLDDRGFDILLHALELQRGQALPVLEIGARLLDMGLADEAQRWILEDERARRHAIVRLIDRFEDPEPLRAAAREDLEKLSDDNPEWYAECCATTAVVFDDAERRQWLERAEGAVDAAGDENLFWDSYYGGEDPRLVLAEAWLAAGDPDAARHWLQRVWENPVPFSDGANGLPQHVAQVWAKLGEAPDGLLERSYEPPAAVWELWRANLVDTPTVLEAIAEMKPEHLVAVFEHGEAETCAAAAMRAVDVLDTFIAAPDEYGNAYAIYMYGGTAIGMAGQWLPANHRLQVLERAWQWLRNPRGPITMWNCWSALIGLLAATPADERAEIEAEMMDHALSTQIRLGFPALCDFEGWSDAFRDRQREYLVFALSQKRLARPDDWIELLVELGDVDAARTALQLARSVGTDEGFAKVAEIAELWAEVAEEAIARFEADEFGVWALSHIIEDAPTPEDAAELASRAWAARFDDIAEMGCAGEMLRALPVEKAEEIAAELIDLDLMQCVSGRHLPPKAQTLFIEATLDDAESLYDRAQAYLNLIDVGVADAERLEKLRAEVLDEAIATVDDDDEAIDALEMLVRHIDGERAAAVAQVLFEYGDPYNHAHLAYRLRELGLDQLIPDDAPQAQLDALGVALRAADTIDDVIEALADEPNARTYPWVSNIIVDRGLSAPWARHVATFDAPNARLIVWDMLWSELDESVRDELMPWVHEAITEEQNSTLGARWRWIERLSRDEVRRHWCNEMKARRQDAEPFVPGAYSQPLALAREHAAALADVVNWFTMES